MANRVAVGVAAPSAVSRNVRPRLSSGPEVAAQAHAPRSPLIGMLQRGVEARTIVMSPDENVFTGFALYNVLAEAACSFTPMNSNRAINPDVVERRVQENIDFHAKHKKYMDFNQINLIVIALEPSNDFLVMDGQHRCETMQELYRRDASKKIVFQFRVKVVDKEEEAFAELDHFQKTYPSDPRSFFRSRVQTRTATAVLYQWKGLYPNAFKEMPLAAREGQLGKDPDRPCLSDNLLFWVLQDSGLLVASGTAHSATGAAAPPLLNAAAILGRLRQMNELMFRLDPPELGKNVTPQMVKRAMEWGMFLGFFREGGLQWGDLAEKLPPLQSPEASGMCLICLAELPSHRLKPCGHLVVCGDCGKAVMAAKPSMCPKCKRNVTGLELAGE